MTMQMTSYTFNAFDHISIIGFLEKFKLACETSGLHEGASMWLFNYFLNKTASTVLIACLSSDCTYRK